MTMNARRGGLTAIVLTTGLVVSACASTSDGGSSAGCEPAPEGEKVELSFSSWIPNFQETVDLWNSENPDVQVNYTEVPQGNNGTYQSYLNQIKSGKTDDLGMIDYDTLPTFRVQDGLLNIYSCPGVADVRDQFVDSVWAQNNFGQDSEVYGLGLDFGPETLFYRSDLFEEAGIAPPQTWDEYYEAAKKIRELGGYIANFGYGSFYATMYMQGGIEWFGQTDSGWTVDIDSPDGAAVTDYIQKLIDEDLVTTFPTFQDQFNQAVANGTVWSQIAGPWYSALLASSAPDLAGKWSTAKEPTWSESDPTIGTWGGATMSVFKDAAHPYEAAQFAIWATTDPAALALNSVRGGLYPPIKDVVSKVPEMQVGLPFFGDQKVFADVNEYADDAASWVWGPTMLQVNADLDAEMGEATAGNKTVAEALAAVQAKTLKAIEGAGIQLAE